MPGFYCFKQELQFDAVCKSFEQEFARSSYPKNLKDHNQLSLLSGGVKVDGFHQLQDRRGANLKYLALDVPVVHDGEVVVDDVALLDFDTGKLVVVVKEVTSVLSESFAMPLADVSEILSISRSDVGRLEIRCESLAQLGPVVDRIGRKPSSHRSPTLPIMVGK